MPKLTSKAEIARRARQRLIQYNIAFRNKYGTPPSHGNSQDMSMDGIKPKYRHLYGYSLQHMDKTP